jgi:hypothetical protein
VSEADAAQVLGKQKMKRPDMALKQDIDLFLMRHDPVATLDEVDDIMYKYARVHGREALNTKLRRRYGQALSDVVLTSEHQASLEHQRTNTFTMGGGRTNGSGATNGSRANGSRANGSGARANGSAARLFAAGNGAPLGGGYQTASERARGYGTVPMEAVDTMLDMGKAHYEQLLNRPNLTAAELDFIRAWQRLANDATIQGEIPLNEV